MSKKNDFTIINDLKEHATYLESIAQAPISACGAFQCDDTLGSGAEAGIDPSPPRLFLYFSGAPCLHMSPRPLTIAVPDGYLLTNFKADGTFNGQFIRFSDTGFRTVVFGRELLQCLATFDCVYLRFGIIFFCRRLCTADTAGSTTAAPVLFIQEPGYIFL